MGSYDWTLDHIDEPGAEYPASGLEEQIERREP